MAGNRVAKITPADIEAMQPGTILWESNTTGFYVRRQKGDARIFGAFYRVLEGPLKGKQRWQTIGRDGALDINKARNIAKGILGDAAKGRDPQGKKQAPPDAAKTATVWQAIETYLSARKERDLIAGARTERGLRHHVLGTSLAKVTLAELTELDLENWRKGLTRGGRGKTKRAKENAKAAPILPATRARIYADVRAALNEAARSMNAGPSVHVAIRNGLRKPKGADVPRSIQVLSDADIRKVVAAAFDIHEDFGALILMLAATGARFSQVAKARVADVQTSHRRVMVPVSAKGRGEKHRTHIPLPLPDDVLNRVRPLLAGRAGHETLLTRWHHRQVEGSKGSAPTWERVERRGWTADSTITRLWRAALKLAGLPDGTIMYALRHSSIVRLLMKNVPVKMVASTHDTSAAMVEKHYAHWILEADDTVIRQAIVPMTSADVAKLKVVAG